MSAARELPDEIVARFGTATRIRTVSFVLRQNEDIAEVAAVLEEALGGWRQHKRDERRKLQRYLHPGR